MPGRIRPALDRADQSPYGYAMHLCRFAFIAVLAALAAASPVIPVNAGPPVPPVVDRPDPPVVLAAAGEETYDIDLVVGLSGKCSVFRAAAQNLPCRAVKY